MKTLELKTTVEKVISGSKEIELEITTGELIRTACNSPVQGGFTASDMIDRIRILDFLTEAEKNKEEILELEDSDFKNLSNYVKNTKWSIVSKTIVEFTKQFEPKTD